jgi:hypothetical protein
MATSHFDNDAKLSGGGQGVGGLSEQDWRRWLPRPDAERSDPAANIVALAHEMCDLVGQLRVAHVKGDPWHLALAAVVVGVEGVVAAHGLPGGAAAVFVSTASRYADWYARQPTVDESTTRPDASAEGATTPGHTTPPAATPTAPRSPRTPAAPAPTTGAAPVDLALNHPVTASSYQTAAYAPYQNFPPSLAVDGDGTTRWSSLAEDPAWIYVDLGATHTVSGARLSWETAYSKDYQIRVSNDAKNWITVYEDSAGNGGIDSFTFTPVTARYVEMFSVARAIPAYGVSLWEFEVLGR